MFVRRKAAVLALALGAAAGMAGAQTYGGNSRAPQGKDACDMDYGGLEVTSAHRYLEPVAANQSKPDEKIRHLRDAVRVLTTNPDHISNKVGADYVMGQVLYYWAEQPGQSLVARRGDLGYVTNPDDSIQIYMAMDSALSRVIEAKPECAASARSYMNKPFATTMNGTAEMIKNENWDSAAVLIELAQRYEPTSPLPVYYQATIDQRLGKNDAALADYKRVVELATAGDTTTAKIRGQALFNSGVLTMNLATAKGGADKTAGAEAAVALFKQYLAEFPSGESAGEAQAALGQALLATGDTAAVAGVYADMLQNPAKYTDDQLVKGGVAAIRGKNFDDAIKLIQSVLDRNPNYRDALYNLGIAYVNNQEYAKALPLSDQLLKVDPLNELAWKLRIAVNKGLSNDLIAAKAKPDSIRKVQAQTLDFVTKSSALPLAVAITEFAHAGNTYTLSGTATNKSATAKEVVLPVEFLDKDGTVVAKADATVSLPPNGSQSFTVKVTQAGIVAFRYSPPA